MIRPIDTLPPLVGDQADQYAAGERIIDEQIAIASMHMHGMRHGVRVSLASVTSVYVARRLWAAYSAAGWVASLYHYAGRLELTLSPGAEIVCLHER